MTIKDLENNGLIIYKHYRGSYAQGTYIEGVSDKDIGGIFILPKNYLYGLECEYIPQVANETNDEVYYELGRFMQLILKHNPTIIESLFIDKEFIIYEHPIMGIIKSIASDYITKKLVHNTVGFATSQIKKCTSSEKLFSHPVTEKKGPLDFCYTFYKQGSTKLINWLDNHGLYQRYCGLVSVPNMHDVYGVYYDWKSHIEDNNISVDDMYDRVHLNGRLRGSDDDVTRFTQTIMEYYNCNTTQNPFLDLQYYLSNLTKRLGYSGIVAEDGSSNTLRYIQDNYTEKDGVMLNSVEKDAKPICYMSFNSDGYAKHLRDYTRYQKWLKERNPVRYENNKDYRYDAKNVMHCFRLLNMAIEMSQGKGILVNRQNIDRDFLLAVRNHTYSYEELMAMLNEKEAEMKQSLETSSLPEEINIDKVNKLLIDIRTKFFNDGKN